MTFDQIEHYFQSKGFEPFDFQRTAWSRSSKRQNQLIVCPTGSGKTLAATGWMLQKLLSDPNIHGLKLLYITPLRAMTKDLELALKEPFDGTLIRILARNGDTTAKDRATLFRRPPQILMTTPESLSVVLSSPKSQLLFANLESIVVDEWHDLLATKRGVQTSLCLARLKKLAPQITITGISATLKTPQAALDALLPQGISGIITKANINRDIKLTVVESDAEARLPWAGYLGLSLLKPVSLKLFQGETTLIFTNTRNQAEQWYQALTIVRMDLKIALHHGSLSSEIRADVEQHLKNGTVDVVVATSALDLGVDFQAIEKVIQIGSPRSVSRLVQRAGRASHRPGATIDVLLVPTNRLHLNEYAALADALDENVIESIRPPLNCTDVLIQHLVTLSLQDPWHPKDLYDEISSIWAYRTLSRDQFMRLLDVLLYGSNSLDAYPEFRRLVRRSDGYFLVASQLAGRRHRMSIGTIVSNVRVRIKMRRGQYLGEVEETFASRLRMGDIFRFAGRRLEAIRFNEGELLVTPARRGNSHEVPSWIGGRLPLSDTLADRVAAHFKRQKPLSDRIQNRDWLARSLRETTESQDRISQCPRDGSLLIERFHTRDGYHMCVYPFAGWLVHQALGPLVAHRLTQQIPATLTLTVNDYGIEFLSPTSEPLDQCCDKWHEMVSSHYIERDLDKALNLSELIRRQFRATARISGLVFEGYPGRRKSLRMLQTSAGLLFDVLSQYDPDHVLLSQAKQDVLHHDFDIPRLRTTLNTLEKTPLNRLKIQQPSPLALPLVINRLSARLSTETVAQRVSRLTRIFDE